MNHDQAAESALRDDILSLAVAVESIVTALLVGDQDLDTAKKLLQEAGALAHAIRQEMQGMAPPSPHA